MKIDDITPETDVQPLVDLASATRRKPLGAEAKKIHISRKDKRELKRDFRRRRAELKQEERELERQTNKRERKEKMDTRAIAKDLKRRDKKKSKEIERLRRTKNVSKSLCTYIAYERMYKDGICEIEPGLFSQTLIFPDVSYQSAREDRQKAIFAVLCELLNYFGSDTHVQFNVLNMPILDEEVGTREFFDVKAHTSEAAKEDAEIFNGILNAKMLEGVSNIKRIRLITYSVHAVNAQAAVQSLSRIRTDISDALGRIGCRAELMDGHARLDILHSQLTPGHRFTFAYDTDISVTSGLSTKDFIVPEALDFKPAGEAACFHNGEVWGSVLCIRRFGSDNTDRMLCELADLPIPINITWHLDPMDKSQAIAYVKQRVNWIDKEIIEEQQRAFAKGYDPNLLPAELSYSRDEAGLVLDDLQNRNQRLIDFTGLIYTYAHSREKLDEQIRHIVDKANSHSVVVESLPLRQREALNSVLPIGQNHIPVGRKLTTAEVAILVPFATQELDQKNGNYVGQNKVSNNLVIANRKSFASPVGFIAGKTGSGKSFFVKQEVESTILNNSNDQIIVIDRAAEYVSLARHHDGTILTFGVDSDSRLNPFDLSNLDNMSRESQIAFKVDAMLAQASASAAETGKGLDECEQSIITRAVEIAFNHASKRRSSPIPTLGDFHDALLDKLVCPEPQAETIALRYERFVKGSMSFFNAQSNIDWSSNVIDINLRNLPDSMLVFALINTCEAVRNQMYLNHAKGLRTWIYVEEIQSMFSYPTVLYYFSRFANEARKFGGIITGITQNSVEMLRNPDARPIVLNADYIMLLKQSPLDRQTWEDLLGLSAEESGCIDETCKRGDGLLIAGAARVPIKGEFPRNNALYELFDTDPNSARV